MAITEFSAVIFRGLSGDTKPAAAEGALFEETDTNLVFIRRSGTWENTAAVGGGLALAGENNTEATSTSTSAGDRVTVSSLSIPATTPVLIVVRFRKSAGAAAACGFGLKINTTVVMEAATGTAPNTTGTNQAESGSFVVLILPRVTNYVVGGQLDGIPLLPLVDWDLLPASYPQREPLKCLTLPLLLWLCVVLAETPPLPMQLMRLECSPFQRHRRYMLLRQIMEG